MDGRKEPPLAKEKGGASDFAEWTHSSACVQSDDPEIKSKAEELQSGTDDLETYVRRATEFCAKNKGLPGEKFFSLDAARALKCGGSCTSRANLAAALLRARGIPARTVAHLPAWGRSGFFEHWLVEYWHPKSGWVWVEPTLNKLQPAPNFVVVLAVSNIADEDRAFDPYQIRYVMPGAAYLSVLELPAELAQVIRTRADLGRNYARCFADVSGTTSEMELLHKEAQAHFNRLYSETKSANDDPIDKAPLKSLKETESAPELTKSLQRASSI